MPKNPHLHAAHENGARRRILVVDDHPLVREGLAELISSQDDVLYCGGADNLRDARAKLIQQKPDLLLLDLRLGKQDGFELLAGLRSEFAGLRVLVISYLDETVYAEKALLAGAFGFVMKEQATEELLRAIRIVLAGQIYLSPTLAVKIARRLQELHPPDLSELNPLNYLAPRSFNHVSKENPPAGR